VLLCWKISWARRSGSVSKLDQRGHFLPVGFLLLLPALLMQPCSMPSCALKLQCARLAEMTSILSFPHKISTDRIY
jgi:hypothetical protein